MLRYSSFAHLKIVFLKIIFSDVLNIYHCWNPFYPWKIINKCIFWNCLIHDWTVLIKISKNIVIGINTFLLVLPCLMCQFNFKLKINAKINISRSKISDIHEQDNRMKGALGICFYFSLLRNVHRVSKQKKSEFSCISVGDVYTDSMLMQRVFMYWIYSCHITNYFRVLKRVNISRF